MDDLIMRVGGAVLDAMDNFDESARNAGVDPAVAERAKASSIVRIRAALGPRLACLRSYALRNVFALPPNGDEAVLDKQIALCTARLAEARAKTRQVTAAERALQRRIDALEEAHAALPDSRITDAEAKVELINNKNVQVERDLDDICDPLPSNNEPELPPANSFGGKYAREFETKRYSDDGSSDVDDDTEAIAKFDAMVTNQ